MTVAVAWTPEASQDSIWEIGVYKSTVGSTKRVSRLLI